MKPSRLSGSFPDHSDTFQTIGKLSRRSRIFPAYLQIIHAIPGLSRPFRNFPDYPETFQTIWKLPSAQGLRAKTFGTRKNFPEGNATMPPGFCASELHCTACNCEKRDKKSRITWAHGPYSNLTDSSCGGSTLKCNI